MSALRMRVAGANLMVTRHAVERYVERVKPHLTFAEGQEELERLLPMAVITREKPVWASERDDQDSWAVLTDAIAFPIARHTVLSCLTRGQVGAGLRVVKRAGRGRARRDPRPKAGGLRKKKQHGKVARAERRRARDAREAFDG